MLLIYRTILLKIYKAYLRYVQVILQASFWQVKQQTPCNCIFSHTERFSKFLLCPTLWIQAGTFTFFWVLCCLAESNTLTMCLWLAFGCRKLSGKKNEPSICAMLMGQEGSTKCMNKSIFHLCLLLLPVYSAYPTAWLEGMKPLMFAGRPSS